MLAFFWRPWFWASVGNFKIGNIKTPISPQFCAFWRFVKNASFTPGIICQRHIMCPCQDLSDNYFYVMMVAVLECGCKVWSTQENRSLLRPWSQCLWNELQFKPHTDVNRCERSKENHIKIRTWGGHSVETNGDGHITLPLFRVRVFCCANLEPLPPETAKEIISFG